MRKIEELNKPDSCLSKARDNERIFVLLARDEAAPHAIQEWCRQRVALGKNTWTDPQITEALDCALKMRIERGEFNDTRTRRQTITKPTA